MAESASKEDPALQIKTVKKDPIKANSKREVKQNPANPKDVASPTPSSEPSNWMMLYDQNTGYYYYWNKVVGDN